MRPKIISILVFLCLFLDCSVAQAQADPVNELIQRVNALRRAYGVPEYQVDYALMYAAQAEAEWGLANLHFGHDGPGGSTPDDRAKAAGYGAGENSFTIENVAAGTASLNTPELVVTMWQNDWGHLNAMISADYEHVGVGFAETEDFSYFVMMVGWVGTKGSSSNPQEPSPPAVNVPGVPFIKSTPDESGAIYHEVQPGQSAWTIAAQYGLELAELFALNNLTADSILHPGDRLMIRAPHTLTSTPTISLTIIPTLIHPADTPVPTVAPIHSTDLPTLGSTGLSATEVPVATAPPVDQSHEKDFVNSAPDTLPLVIGVGLVLVIGIVIVVRLRKL